jgi:hypothetical protein
MKIQALKFLLVLLLCFPLAANSQGFGLIQKKLATINRLLPPTVNLKGKRIRVEATADAIQKDGEMLHSLLKTKLVTLIQKDPRFILNQTSPETILRFSITNFHIEKWTSGTGQYQTTSYGGKIEVAYQALDEASNIALDSENLVTTAGHDPNQGATFSLHLDPKKRAAESSEEETRDQLINGIVDEMGRRIAPLDEPFEAPLPGGKLEPISAMALTARWGTMEEQAEKADKLPKGNDDTYRLYLIAIAKEAQAYELTREANERDLDKRSDISPAQAEAEFKRAQQYLDESGTLYKQIVTANPKEKEFRAGDARTEEALAIYAKIERYKAENAKAVAAAAAARAAGDKDIRAGGSAQTPLEQVLEFCSKGLAFESMKEYIDSPDFLADAKATGYKFNFAKDSVRLNDTCKQNAAALQKALRVRLAVAPAHK